jgi:hypothetical protein
MKRPCKFSDLELLAHLVFAARENPDDKARRRTDLIGIARHYGGKLASRADYERVLKTPVAYLLHEHLHEDRYKPRKKSSNESV